MAVKAAAQQPGSLVRVEGGPFKNTRSTNYHERKITLPDFHLGKYEVTQKEWTDVMGGNPSQFKGDNLPVDSVNWYECIEYCNKRSLKEGFKPYYSIDRSKRDPNNTNDIDDLRWTVTINDGANGYRLPTEAEWEYAAGGGRLSRSYTYCGGNDLDKVGWYWKNSGDQVLSGFWHWPTIERNRCRTKPVGGMEPNELGFFDMSGNVREWCWDWSPDNGGSRVWKGGGWLGGDFCCEPSFRAGYEANGRGPDQGLRVCRSQ